MQGRIGPLHCEPSGVGLLIDSDQFQTRTPVGQSVPTGSAQGGNDQRKVIVSPANEHELEFGQ